MLKNIMAKMQFLKEMSSKLTLFFIITAVLSGLSDLVYAAPPLKMPGSGAGPAPVAVPAPAAPAPTPVIVMPPVAIAAPVIPQPTVPPLDPVTKTLCTISNYLTGTTGRGIATVAVVFVGIGLFLGKMSWGIAVAVGIGIGAIFGADAIVNLLGGGTSTCV